MRNKDLLKRLELLGYPLFETEENLDINKTLAEVVKTGNLRLWESFPLLLVNSFKKEFFNTKTVEKYLKTMSDKMYFKRLVVMSIALYEYLRLDFPWLDGLKKAAFFNKKIFNEFLSQFKERGDLSKHVKKLSSTRVVNTFRRYFEPKAQELKEYTQMKGEFDLEYSLSQIFSKKQKELFMRKLRGEKMTKTEREYYSRSVRKKVSALANPDLHKLAIKLSQQ